MTYQGRISFKTAERLQQRAAEKRRRELERRAKEEAKLSELEKLRCEVDLYENQIELLLSVHKEQGPSWDWSAVAAILPPPTPRRESDCEFKARREACLAPDSDRETSTARIAQARAQDDHAYQSALQDYAAETAEIERLRPLAERILAGEPKAYTDALVELSPLAELSSLGSDIHFTVHSVELLECRLKVNGTQAIPNEVKSLTATGKLSIRRMPRARFHELYQDYICGCILRVARETFALLPIETVLITATADENGQETAVLSAAIDRKAFHSLDFSNLDPSDTLDSFLHRGDFKATRKAGAFASIQPLTPAEIRGKAAPQADTESLLAQATALRKDIRAKLSDLGSKALDHPITAT